MSIHAGFCPLESTTYHVKMKLLTSNKHSVTWYMFHYSEYLSPYVFTCLLMSVYTQHYGGRHARQQRDQSVYER